MRDARRARHAGEYPSHRLPSFLRAAFHVRDRTARLQGAGERGGRCGRGLSRADRRRLRPDAALGREIYRDVKAQDAPQTVERILKAYLAHRASRDESFIAFARRHEIDALKA